ncbi:hypothetical protein DL770_004093 [Monosporascus sp. CRB-9-2]|nr:hypothetical protein DL770_004093 [Monosporascus sp. CRB-9-2]
MPTTCVGSISGPPSPTRRSRTPPELTSLTCAEKLGDPAAREGREPPQEREDRSVAPFSLLQGAPGSVTTRGSTCNLTIGTLHGDARARSMSAQGWVPPSVDRRTTHAGREQGAAFAARGREYLSPRSRPVSAMTAIRIFESLGSVLAPRHFDNAPLSAYSSG